MSQIFKKGFNSLSQKREKKSVQFFESYKNKEFNSLRRIQKKFNSVSRIQKKSMMCSVKNEET